jgi:hypothetical protein
MLGRKETPTSMIGWGNKFIETGWNERVTDPFSETEEVKLRGAETLRKLDLPFLTSATSSLSRFLANPEELYNRLGDHNKYHVSLISDKWSTRLRRFNLDPEGVEEFIEEKVDPEKIADFTIILKRFYENKYGGNIVIGENGRVRIELVGGNHLGVVEGNVPLEAFSESDPYSGILKHYEYSDGKIVDLSNDRLRQIIIRALHYIPCILKDHEGESLEKRYHPSYYEFIVTPDSQIFFIDYRDRPIYQLKQDGPPPIFISREEEEANKQFLEKKRGEENKAKAPALPLRKKQTWYLYD